MTLFAFVDGKALADETAVNPNLYGPWELMVLESAGMTIRLTLIIKTGEVIASNTCSFQEYSVQAEVSSSAVITPDQIHILESNKVQKEYSPGFLGCKASVNKGDIHYQLEGDKLILTMAGRDETVELSRIHPWWPNRIIEARDVILVILPIVDENKSACIYYFYIYSVWNVVVIMSKEGRVATEPATGSGQLRPTVLFIGEIYAN